MIVYAPVKFRALAHQLHWRTQGAKATLLPG